MSKESKFVVGIRVIFNYVNIATGIKYKLKGVVHDILDTGQVLIFLDAAAPTYMTGLDYPIIHIFAEKSQCTILKPKKKKIKKWANLYYGIPQCPFEKNIGIRKFYIQQVYSSKEEAEYSKCTDGSYIKTISFKVKEDF